MVVDVVDVDQFASVDDVADNACSEGQSHLILLKIQNSGVKRERERERCYCSALYPPAEIYNRERGREGRGNRKLVFILF